MRKTEKLENIVRVSKKYYDAHKYEMLNDKTCNFQTVTAMSKVFELQNEIYMFKAKNIWGNVCRDIKKKFGTHGANTKFEVVSYKFENNKFSKVVFNGIVNGTRSGDDVPLRFVSSDNKNVCFDIICSMKGSDYCCAYWLRFEDGTNECDIFESDIIKYDENVRIESIDVEKHKKFFEIAEIRDNNFVLGGSSICDETSDRIIIINKPF